MESKIDSLKKELHALREQGHNLYLAMLDDVRGLPDDFKKDLKKSHNQPNCQRSNLIKYLFI